MMIIGSGRIAYYLLNILKNTRMNLKVIENNPEQAQMFSQEFPNVHVVQGVSVRLKVCFWKNVWKILDAVATLNRGGMKKTSLLCSLKHLVYEKISLKLTVQACLKLLILANFQVLSYQKYCRGFNDATLSVVV